MTPYKEGYLAFQEGKSLEANPYEFVEEDGSLHQQWVSGWYDAQDDSRV